MVSGVARAEPGTWATDPSVGVTELAVTLQVSCEGESFICSQIDGYSDTQVTALSGSGDLEADENAGAIQFLTDGDVDLGSGPQAVFNRLGGGSITFAYLPFAGIPQLQNLETFATADPAWMPVGWSSWTPGDFPLSVIVPYSVTAEVVGDLEFNVPDLKLPAQNVETAGIWRVSGDPSLGGQIAYELRGLQTSVSHDQVAQILGEPVTLQLTLELTSNLSGAAGVPPPVPLLQNWGLAGLAAMILAFGALGLSSKENRFAASMRKTGQA